MPKQAMEKTKSRKKSVKKKKTDKTKKTKKTKKITPIIEVKTQNEEKKSKRTKPTRESVINDFDNTLARISGEIETLRSTVPRASGVKFLRTIAKILKIHKGRTARVFKQKVKTKRKNNNSGFLKPVPISKEMANFTGWDPEELKSRVDVTKFICSYVKEHNLQNPADKRQIKPDKKLKKLLKYEHNPEAPLTYYRLQTYMKPHFTKKDD